MKPPSEVPPTTARSEAVVTVAEGDSTVAAGKAAAADSTVGAEEAAAVAT